MKFSPRSLRNKIVGVMTEESAANPAFPISWEPVLRRNHPKASTRLSPFSQEPTEGPRISRVCSDVHESRCSGLCCVVFSSRSTKRTGRLPRPGP